MIEPLVARCLAQFEPFFFYLIGQAYDRLYLELFGLDPRMAPPGKGTFKVELTTSYSYWDALHQDRERYDAEKQRVAEVVIDQLEPRFPGLKGQIEVVDVATPITYERYTGNWQGSMEGWLLTTKTMPMSAGRGMDKTLPGLAGFYMIGQWVEPGGGVPTAAMSARRVMEMICKQNGKTFEAQVP